MSSSDFKIIRPLTVTDSLLTSTNVPEATISNYNGGTTYATGDQAGTTSGTVQTIYKSLQNSNTGHTPASSPTWWESVGVVYAAYAGGTTYGLGDIVSSISTNVHLLYESQTSGNVGNALTDTAHWLLIGSTNRWAMFDASYNSQTTNADTIVVTIAPGEIANTVALLNVGAATVTVAQSVSGYSKTVNMNRHQVNNWYDWFYEDILRSGDVVFTDIPPYASGVLTVTIDNTGGTAAIGCCYIGKSRILGTTTNDLSRTINDYSVSSEDAFGNVNLLKRAFSKRLTVPVQVTNGFESEVARILEEYRATPLVFVGSDSVDMTIIYGFLGAWDISMPLTGKASNIEIKGLI